MTTDRSLSTLDHADLAAATGGLALPSLSSLRTRVGSLLGPRRPYDHAVAGPSTLTGSPDPRCTHGLFAPLPPGCSDRAPRRPR